MAQSTLLAMTEDALKNLESSEELFVLHRTWAGGRSLTISEDTAFAASYQRSDNGSELAPVPLSQNSRNQFNAR